MTANQQRALVLTGAQAGTGSLVPILFASILLVPIALLGPNTPLALLAWLTLVVGIRLLWRPGEPPILLLIFIYQWIEAAIGLFYGNLLGVEADHWTEHGGQHNQAILLTLIALAILAIAMRIATGPQAVGLSARIRAAIHETPLKTWAYIYAGSWAFSQVCLFVAPMSQGFTSRCCFSRN